MILVIQLFMLFTMYTMFMECVGEMSHVFIVADTDRTKVTCKSESKIHGRFMDAGKAIPARTMYGRVDFALWDEIDSLIDTLLFIYIKYIQTKVFRMMSQLYGTSIGIN
jgi:hypothetical protein